MRVSTAAAPHRTRLLMPSCARDVKAASTLPQRKIAHHGQPNPGRPAGSHDPAAIPQVTSPQRSQEDRMITVSQQQLLGVLKATGSRDPDVLFAAKEATMATQRQLKLV